MPLLLYLAILPLLLATAPKAPTQNDATALLDSLDAAIDRAPHYEAMKQTRISQLKRQLRSGGSAEVRFKLGLRLYEEYRSYKNDSAISAARYSLDIARQSGRTDRVGLCLSLIAYQSSTAGHYADAEATLRQVDVGRLQGRGLFCYYRAQNHLYSETAYYSHLQDVKDSAHALALRYERLMLNSVDKNTGEHREYLCRSLYNAHRYAEAQRVCDQWLQEVSEETHEYAMVAYYEYRLRLAARDTAGMIRWLARSAINDVKLSTTDQASLWSLAEIINGTDNARAYRYVKFSWQCAQTFGTDVRSRQISPILSAIEAQYQLQADRSFHRLRLFALVITLLAAALLSMLYYANRQRRRLAQARNDLDKRNSELAEMNRKLNAMNAEMKTVNAQLSESNTVKEFYIGRFLAICSDYVDRLDQNRRHANRMIREHKVDELYEQTRSNGQKDRNVEELYNHFDRAFLSIFPHFVDELNALLRPECQITVPEGNLNTTLRIFALIRLGIDDSGKIAELLHYSVNTIYNYRTRTKNGCAGDRGSFEEKVKSLGRIGK